VPVLGTIPPSGHGHERAVLGLGSVPLRDLPAKGGIGKPPHSPGRDDGRRAQGNQPWHPCPNLMASVNGGVRPSRSASGATSRSRAALPQVGQYLHLMRGWNISID
jgi:hypothetical protein